MFFFNLQAATNLRTASQRRLSHLFAKQNLHLIVMVVEAVPKMPDGRALAMIVVRSMTC